MAVALNLPSIELSRLKGRGPRTQNLSTKLTQAEEAELERASMAEDKTLSEWARDVLLRSARHEEIRSEPSAVLTEVVGIQLFLMNVLSPLSRGERLSAEQYQNIVKSVQENKARVTEELIAKRSRKEQ